MSNVHPIFDRILSTMNGSHELTAEQRAELRDPKHADVAKQLHSPATPTQPAPTDVAGGGAGGVLGHLDNGGGFTLTDDQFNALKNMAVLSVTARDFTILRDWVELQIDQARLDAAYQAARKAIDQAFDVARKAVEQ